MTSILSLVEDIKTTFRIPDDLLKQFKHLAIDEDTSINNLMVEAMKMLLRSRAKKSGQNLSK